MNPRRRALVTGAGQRVGAEIAATLGASGFDVAVHARSSVAGAEAVLDRVRAAGGDGFVVTGDLATVPGCSSVVDAVRARWDHLDVLVNNASAFEPVPFEKIGVDAWEAMLGVNLRAPFLLSQGLLPLLGAARSPSGRDGEGGLVVHLCDIGADRPVSGYAHYSVSKAGLVMLVKAMAVELAPAVRTVGVSPGQVIWPDDYPPSLREKLAKRIPMARVGSPADVAALVRFLATEGHYLNGVVVPVDGGLSVRY
jgi:pteridine reductase